MSCGFTKEKNTGFYFFQFSQLLQTTKIYQGFYFDQKKVCRLERKTSETKTSWTSAFAGKPKIVRHWLSPIFKKPTSSC